MGGAPSTLLQESPLLLGGADVLKPGSDWLESNNIAAVVSICDQCPPPREGLQVLHINQADMPDTDLAPFFAQTSKFIHTARAHGGAVYIHCVAGVSRSTTIATAYLMAFLGLTRGQALGHVHRCREAACPNEGFLAQLANFEGAAAAAVGKELAALDLPGAPERQHVMRARDLRAVADSLQSAEEEAREHAQAEWYYRSDGAIVPLDLVAKITNPDDGNGPRVQPDPTKEGFASFRMVVPRGGDQYGQVVAPNWGLEDYETQMKRLRVLLQPQLDAGARAGGSVGLEWLLAPPTAQANATKAGDD